MARALVDMSVEELEQASYRLTEERQVLRAKQLAVQSMLGKRVEEQRISHLLGRDVQIVEAKGLESTEAVGDA